jgi:hypothetical protein
VNIEFYQIGFDASFFAAFSFVAQSADLETTVVFVKEIPDFLVDDEIVSFFK